MRLLRLVKVYCKQSNAGQGYSYLTAHVSHLDTKQTLLMGQPVSSPATAPEEIQGQLHFMWHQDGSKDNYTSCGIKIIILVKHCLNPLALTSMTLT